MDYKEAVLYLNSFINNEKNKNFSYKKFRLERVREILNFLDNPHEKITAIHIAGTKGKGSTAAFISSILKKAGYKTGLYTSPHLHDFRERIQLNSRKISKRDLMRVVKKVKVAVDEYLEKGSSRPTFFEIYTIAAFLYFSYKRADIVVLEVGIGGRLDATNVVRSLISVITPISYEHTGKLGKTLAKIAAEKAGIIKERSMAISAPQPKAAERVIESRAREVKAGLLVIGKDVCFKEGKFNGRFQSFTVRSMSGRLFNLKTSLLGRHQMINASCGVAAIEALNSYHIKVSSDAVESGVNSARWPGRLEVAARKPLVVLDGAQNKASARVLKEAVLKLFKYSRLILILGVSEDKDIKGICSVLEKISDVIILTKALHPRAVSVDCIKKHISDKKKIYLSNSVSNALELAREKAGENDLILAAGSLFVVAEARKIIRADKNG
ncbi:MAG: bifunctional folylpolyglutamate synthase/dihydrofolate synthase [Candidatus Omnitrophica bacterium]|nr:bifunctional folylpolyglutamate synthase/dihydrofolate synthase [Candidatus Omnitrophota bacterium]